VIERTFPKKVLKTKIRRDINVSEASIFGKPLFETAPTSRAAEDYLSIAKELQKRINTAR
jgi:chromosome partitioning protein